MTSPCIKITQVKLDVRQILKNLERLEDLEVNQFNLEELKNDTEKLLCDLELMPLEFLRTKHSKQQRKRRLKRLRKLKIQEKLNIANYTDLEVSTSSKLLEIQKNLKTKPKLHHQLRSLHECQRFLKTFELLEQLHLTRGQNNFETRKFSAKLQKLKSIWNCLLQEQQEQTSTNLKIQKQWDEVLFGPPEKSYFQEKTDLPNFLTKRQIWDSYIDNKHGTSIPTGRVLPPLDVKEKWSSYLSSDV